MRELALGLARSSRFGNLSRVVGACYARARIPENWKGRWMCIVCETLSRSPARCASERASERDKEGHTSSCRIITHALTRNQRVYGAAGSPRRYKSGLKVGKRKGEKTDKNFRAAIYKQYITTELETIYKGDVRRVTSVSTDFNLINSTVRLFRWYRPIALVNSDRRPVRLVNSDGTSSR